MERWIGKSPAIIYYGLRADENRTGYVPVAGSTITPAYPLQELGIYFQEVFPTDKPHNSLLEAAESTKAEISNLQTQLSEARAEAAEERSARKKPEALFCRCGCSGLDGDCVGAYRDEIGTLQEQVADLSAQLAAAVSALGDEWARDTLNEPARFQVTYTTERWEEIMQARKNIPQAAKDYEARILTNFAQAVLHGSEAHRDWLRESAKQYAKNKTVLPYDGSEDDRIRQE